MTKKHFIFYQENIQKLSKSDDFDIGNNTVFFSSCEILYASSSIEMAEMASKQGVNTSWATKKS